MTSRLVGWLVLVVLLVAPTRTARADDTTYRNLLQRALAGLQQADVHHRAGRLGKAAEVARRARTLVEQADRLKPGDLGTAFLAVQASVLMGDRDGARLWLGRYEKRTPYGEKDANLQYARAMVWLILENRPARAAKTLEHLFRVAPDRRNTQHDLLYYAALMADGSDLVRARKGHEAVQQFRRAVQTARRLRQPRKETAARANVGITLQQFGRAEDSAKVFLALRTGDRKNVLWAWYLGRALAMLHRHGEALALFREVATAVDEGRAPKTQRDVLTHVRLALGKSLREQARAEADDPKARAEALSDARGEFERFTKLRPDVAEGWHRLGLLLYEDLELPHEAMAALQKAHELDPVCDGALRLLIRIAARQGPRPLEDPEAMAKAVEAWDARRAAWEKEMEANAERWEAERDRRRKQDPRGSDGCP